MMTNVMEDMTGYLKEPGKRSFRHLINGAKTSIYPSRNIMFASSSVLLMTLIVPSKGIGWHLNDHESYQLVVSESIKTLRSYTRSY